MSCRANFIERWLAKKCISFAKRYHPTLKEARPGEMHKTIGEMHPYVVRAVNAERELERIRVRYRDTLVIATRHKKYLKSNDWCNEPIIDPYKGNDKIAKKYHFDYLTYLEKSE